MDHDEPEVFDGLTPSDDPAGPGADAATSFDRTRPAGLTGARRTTARLGISVPGAIGGALLVCAIAFGASGGFASPSGGNDDPSTAAADGSVTGGADEDGKDDDAGADAEPTKTPVEEIDREPTKEPTSEPTKEPTPEPTEKPRPTAEPTKRPDTEPTKKPTPEPTKEPTPKPTEKPVLEIGLAAKEGAIVIEWSSCTVDGAEVYKVVRSSDEGVAWPAGDGDDLVAAVEIGGTTRVVDDGAPAGKAAWYRVFCVRHTEDGYRVLAASKARAIEVTKPTPKPTPEPTPEPSAMWIETGVDGGAVVIHWEACGSDGFSHYRILRKVDAEASLLAEIEDPATTTFVDEGVEPGTTYRYLVQAKGHVGDAWVLLGTTEWATVTVD
jgi:hypothetical protein